MGGTRCNFRECVDLVTHTAVTYNCVTAVDVTVPTPPHPLPFSLYFHLYPPLILPSPLTHFSHSLSLSLSTMHQAIPYRTCIPTGTRDMSHAGGIKESNDADPSNVDTMVSENAVVIIGKRGCCMCHVVKRLLQGLGVNPPVYEVDEDHEAAVARHLSPQGTETVQFPAVFLAGKLFGGLERVMATHISGELVPILKDAGALWL